MTDKELVAILESKLPQELSVEEIETIRRRLPKSPELRAALAEQLELNESLAATIGPIDLQADEIAASARRFRRLFPRSVLAALGWTAGLVILLFVAWRVAFQNPNTAPQNRTASIAQQPNRPTTIRSLKPILAPGSDVVPSARLPNSAKVNENLSVSNQQPIQKSDTSTAPTHGVATDRADNAAPQSPWQAKEQLAGPPRPWDQAALEMIGAGVADSPEINAGFPGDAPGLTEVREWFARVPSQWNDIRQTYWHGHLLSAISGLTQFRGPWSNDNVLRLSLCDCTRLAIHFWRGQTGLSLRMYDNHWSLTAYRTQRDGQQATPKKFVTLATDDMRNWMSCGGMFPWRLDLRFDGKEFIVSRGELALLRARRSTACRARRTSTARRFSPGLIWCASPVKFPAKQIRCRLQKRFGSRRGFDGAKWPDQTRDIPSPARLSSPQALAPLPKGERGKMAAGVQPDGRWVGGVGSIRLQGADCAMVRSAAGWPLRNRDGAGPSHAGRSRRVWQWCDGSGGMRCIFSRRSDRRHVVPVGAA